MHFIYNYWSFNIIVANIGTLPVVTSTFNDLVSEGHIIVYRQLLKCGGG